MQISSDKCWINSFCHKRMIFTYWHHSVETQLKRWFVPKFPFLSELTAVRSKNGPNNMSWFFTSRLKCKVLLLWSGIHFGSHQSGPANFWFASDSRFPVWVPGPNWAMIRLSRPKWSLIRFSRPKWPLTTLSWPKWPLIGLSRSRWLLGLEHGPGTVWSEAIYVWKIWMEVICDRKVWSEVTSVLK